MKNEDNISIRPSLKNKGIKAKIQKLATAEKRSLNEYIEELLVIQSKSRKKLFK